MITYFSNSNWIAKLAYTITSDGPRVLVVNWKGGTGEKPPVGFIEDVVMEKCRKEVNIQRGITITKL